MMLKLLTALIPKPYIYAILILSIIAASAYLIHVGYAWHRNSAEKLAVKEGLTDINQSLAEIERNNEIQNHRLDTRAAVIERLRSHKLNP